MKNCTVTPTPSLTGSILPPPSKSQTLRAILFASLAAGTSHLENLLDSTDARSMLHACKLMGAKIEKTEKGFTVQGTGGAIQPPDDVINAGNSGIVLRFVSAVAGLGTSPIVITGDTSIRNQRPMQEMLNSLDQLGISAVSTRGNGFAPLIIQGPPKSYKTTVVGRDSQPVSSMLILGAFSTTPIEIDVVDPGELPWIDLTLAWMDFLKVPYEIHDYKSYKIGGQQQVEGFDYFVPTDMSSTAFPVTAAVITGSSLRIKGVDFEDKQGDAFYFDILKQMGANLTIKSDEKILEVSPGNGLNGVTVDINNCIDAICILAVAACYADGETRITNASIARTKECNRIACLVEELSKMGADIQETEDGLLIKGKPLAGDDVGSHGDHRMAMSLCVAGLGANGSTTVHGMECIQKTYPTFIEDFQAIGARFEEYYS